MEKLKFFKHLKINGVSTFDSFLTQLTLNEIDAEGSVI